MATFTYTIGVRTASAATKYARLTTGTNHAVGTEWVAQ